jgi:phosphotransferase system enzyme I (PtsP)
MFPMVSNVAEFRAAKALLEAEARKVDAPPERLEVGTMLEVPALLFQLQTLLPLIDFLSLGTNDLMQFLFAADRGTASLAHRYDPLCPPFLDILEHVRIHAAAAKVPLSVCGEIAARPLEAMTLAAMGLTTLSMPATALPSQKAFLADLDLAAFRPVLASIRRNAEGEASLREPIASWAHEHGLHE